MNNKEKEINDKDDYIIKLYNICNHIIREVYDLNEAETEKFATSFDLHRPELYDIFNKIPESEIENIAKIVAVRSINYLFKNMSKVYDISKELQRERETYEKTKYIMQMIINQYNNFKLNS